MDEKDVKELAKEIAKELSQNGIELTADYREVVMERNHALVELAEAKARLAWIPVSSGKLPKPNERVLVCTKGGYMEVDFRFAEPIIDCGIADFYSVDNVTHWMPLPEAPKEDE